MNVAVVAGVGPGLGSSLARSFAKEGYAVALISRHREPSDPVAAQIRSLNGNVIVDAQIDTPKLRRRDPQRLPDTIIPPDAIADAIVHAMKQPRNAWIQEIDIRPYVESF